MPNRWRSADPQYAYAVQRIDECLEHHSIFCNLSGLGLSEVPSEIARLTNVASIDLSNNQLTELPPEIDKLSSLTTLDLNSNQFTEFPTVICQFPALTNLDLRHNRIASLPREIAELAALATLDVRVNPLTSLPPEIGELRALSMLLLSGAKLSALPEEIAKLRALGTLTLGGNLLTTLPPGLGRLTALTNLDVSNNLLVAIPPEIGRLTALKELDLSKNQLKALPPEIGGLRSLTELYLFDNQLSSLPAEIGSLANLTNLALSRNRLTALPPEIGGLTGLTKLGITGNQLASLPPEIGKLSALTELSLRGNQLQSLPSTLANLPRLQSLFLHDNPGLDLSPEILGLNPEDGTGPFASAKSILDFYFSRQFSSTRPLNKVKLILVGRGGAGKTSTVRAIRGEPFQDDEKSTPGIALCDWKMDGCQGEPVTAHIWDFAGQVITHALHQFFFSVRSVYVVVLSGRENSERQDAEYWLRLIKAFGTDGEGKGPPVIVALNKWDLAGCRPRIDRGALLERYPFIRGFVELDCQTKRGVDKLKADLCAEVDRLPWVREPFPEAWDGVRLALTKGDKSRAHLPYGEFRRLCVEHGVTDEGQQNSLSEILHNLGAALNFRTDPRLREATVLQPDWLTANVYALMRHAEAHEGVLHQADVDQVLSSEPSTAMRAYLMQIMERFEITYARGSPAALWLVPQALPDDQPASATEFRGVADATRLRYTYQALPEGLVARAIVRLHEFIEEVDDRKQQWGSGAILARDDARALIRADLQDRQVMITVTGSPAARQQLAGLCRAEMRDIHDVIRGLNPIEETQVRGAWVATAALEVDERNGRETGVATTDRGTVMVNPVEANNAFTEKQARSDDDWKPRVFVCYSKSNMAQRNRLDKELKILQGRGKLVSRWHDGMLDAGDKWDQVIQSELAKANVVIVLISTDSLATDYITNREIPKAMTSNSPGQEKVVVPVILENCLWKETVLSELGALPTKRETLEQMETAGGWMARHRGGPVGVVREIDGAGWQEQSLADSCRPFPPPHNSRSSGRSACRCGKRLFSGSSRG